MNFARTSSSRRRRPSVDTPTAFALPVLRARRARDLPDRPRLRDAHRPLRARPQPRRQPDDRRDSRRQRRVLRRRPHAGRARRRARGDDRRVALAAARAGAVEIHVVERPVDSVAADEAPTNAAAGGAHDGSSDDLYLGETVITWNGWSLGAPRPKQSSTRATVRSSRTRATRTPTASRWRSVLRPRRVRCRACGTAATTSSARAPSTSRATAFRSPTRRPRTRRARSCSAGSSRSRVRRSCCARRSARATPSIASCCAATTTRRRARDRRTAHHRAQGVASDGRDARHVRHPGRRVDGRRQRVHVDHREESKKVSDLSSAQPDPTGNDVYYFDVDRVTRAVPSRSGRDRRVAARPRRRGQRGAGRLRRRRGPTSAACASCMHESRAPGDPPFLYDAPNQRLDMLRRQGRHARRAA